MFKDEKNIFNIEHIKQAKNPYITTKNRETLIFQGFPDWWSQQDSNL